MSPTFSVFLHSNKRNSNFYKVVCHLLFQCFYTVFLLTLKSAEGYVTSGVEKSPVKAVQPTRLYDLFFIIQCLFFFVLYDLDADHLCLIGNLLFQPVVRPVAKHKRLTVLIVLLCLVLTGLLVQ